MQRKLLRRPRERLSRRRPNKRLRKERRLKSLPNTRMLRPRFKLLTSTISTLELPQMKSLFNLMRMLVTSTTLNSGTTRLKSKLTLSRRPSKPKMKLKRRPVKFTEPPMDLPRRNSCLLRKERLRSKRLITRLLILRRFTME